MLAGSGLAHSDGHTRPIGPGDVLVLPPRSVHRIVNTSDTDRLYTITVMAPDDGFAALIERGPVACLGPRGPGRPAGEQEALMAVPDPWFLTRPLRDGGWLVAEPSHVYCFLVVGADRAVLIDTGTGIADISAPVRRVTGAPVLVVNTHAHDDHRGGNVYFDEVAAHPAAVGRLAHAVPADRVGAYLTVAAEQLAAYETALALDDRYFHLFTADIRPRPLPPGVSVAAAAPIGTGPAARPLADGDVIDLGGRTLRVLHSPGHSPDSLCLFDERDGLLFVGDTLITGDFWRTPTTPTWRRSSPACAASTVSSPARSAGSCRRTPGPARPGRTCCATPPTRSRPAHRAQHRRAGPRPVWPARAAPPLHRVQHPSPGRLGGRGRGRSSRRAGTMAG